VQSTRDDPGPVLYVHVFNGTERGEFVYYEEDGSSAVSRARRQLCSAVSQD
jgi:hypothetical protein